MRHFLKILKIALALGALLTALWLTWVTRLSNADQVLVVDGVYFVDQDCYSRMMRVFGPGQEPLPADMTVSVFENWPIGVAQHTTWPMDGAIRLVNLFAPGPDLAGAWVSPVLALVAVVFLAAWAWRLRLRDGWMPPALVAISPILAMGTIFGRPDHQSLLILLLTIALASEIAILRGVRNDDAKPHWPVLSGLAWGLALWTSLYEPGVLLLIVALLHLALCREALVWERRKWFLIPFGILLIPALIEAWPITLPGSGAGQEYFDNWAAAIPELRSYGLALIFGGVRAGGGSMVDWVGWGLFLAPWLFAASWILKRDRIVLWTALLTLAGILLAMWQVRWAFYTVLIFGLSLPWQMRALPQGWMAGLLFLPPLLWPVGAHWEKLLYPPPAQERLIDQQIMDQQLLRQMATRIGEQAAPDNRAQGILAPWWMSPSLAWWSGFPAVAGSSHQSLPGIADSFRFYATTDFDEAAEILDERQVHWVVAEDPKRVLPMAAKFFEEDPRKDAAVPSPDLTHPEVEEEIRVEGRARPEPLLEDQADTMAVALYYGRVQVPAFLELESEHRFYKLYRVDHEVLARRLERSKEKANR